MPALYWKEVIRSMGFVNRKIAGSHDEEFELDIGQSHDDAMAREKMNKVFLIIPEKDVEAIVVEKNGRVQGSPQSLAAASQPHRKVSRKAGRRQVSARP